MFYLFTLPMQHYIFIEWTIVMIKFGIMNMFYKNKRRQNIREVQL